MEENCKYCLMNCPNAGQEGKDETDICENYWGPYADSVIPDDPAEEDNPSAACAGSSPYTGEPGAEGTLERAGQAAAPTI